MLRFVICFLVCLTVLSSSSYCQARKAKPVDNGPKKVETVTEPVVYPPPQQITKIRWTMQNNAVLNDNWLRLVLDVTGPVEAEATVVNTSGLAVRVKGAVPDGVEKALPLDGQIATAATLDTDGNGSKLIIALTGAAEMSNCRIFTLPPDAATNKPFRVIVDVSTPAPPPAYRYMPGLKGKTIVLDPGHGGSDAGAVGPGGTLEKTVTLAVAGDVKALLEQAGAQVFLTREGDYDVFGPQASARDELQARVNLAEQHRADLFISIHANAAANPLAQGTSAFYYKKTAYDALLAYNIQNSMIRAGGLKDRSFFPANFHVVKYASIPAALVELAFISNAEEERLLCDQQFQQKMARGIAAGVERFFTEASAMNASQRIN